MNQQGTGEELQVVGQICPELRAWISRVLHVQGEALTSALTFSTLFPMPPTVLGYGWGDSERDRQRWLLTIEHSDQPGWENVSWPHSMLVVLDEHSCGTLARIW